MNHIKSIIRKRPKNWSSLPLYKKVAIYQTYLGPLHAPFVDKLIAKKIVKSICGDDIDVAPVIRILESPQDLRDSDLQPNYLIKAAHGSKWNIDPAREVGRRSRSHIIQQLQLWNRTYSPGLEKQYSTILPRFFVEEKIVDKYHENYASLGKNMASCDDAIVYMCRVIYGRVVSISARLGDLRNDYDRNWNVIGAFQLPFIQDKGCFERMIRNAEKLAAPFEFVRMDFYLGADEKIYFSEFTFSPTCGLSTLPGNLEYTLSRYWV